MDENRAQAYTNLIQQLLSCPNGEEPQILQANSELLDAEFLMVCQIIAENLAGEGQENAANFLRNLARQLGQFLGMNQGGNSDYLEFLIQLLQTVSDSEGNPQQVYPFLQQNLEQLDLQLVQILTAWANDTFAKVEATQAYNIALDIFNLGNLIKQFPLGSRLVNLEIAIAGYEIVAIVFNRDAFPEAWATTQNNLGLAYWDRIRGEKAENIESAIASYTAALEVRTRQAFPQQWAQTQNNLAIAYRNRIRGEKAENIESAIASYTAALAVLTREAFPQDWAQTQYNLAIAYSDRIRGEKAENIESAIASYTAALEVRTREAFPQDWAMTQNNLATAYWDRIRGEKAENIESAIASYTAALAVYTRQAFPQQWATTQNNLAVAYRDRIRGEKAENIESAIRCYKEALEIRTPSAFPLDCLQSGYYLGNLAFDIQDWNNAIYGYENAISAVEQSRDWSTSQRSKRKILEDALPIYEKLVLASINAQRYETALLTVERSKSRTLIELLDNANLYPKNATDDQKQRLRQLRRQIASLQQQLDSNEPPGETDTNTNTSQGNRSISTPERPQTATSSLEAELKTRQQQLTELLTEINDPDFTLTQRVIPQLPDFTQFLDSQTALIEWYLPPNPESGFHAFIVTRTRRGSAPVPALNPKGATTGGLPLQIQIQHLAFTPEHRQQLDSDIATYLSDYNQSTWGNALSQRLLTLAASLHLNQILAKLPPTIEKLILIPHRDLHLLPLHALSATRNLPNSETKTGYLLDLYTNGIQYAPSSQFLERLHQRQRPPINDIFPLFAIQNPTEDLRYTEIEVEEISRAFNPHAHILKRSEATKIAFKSEATLKKLTDSYYAHFSCHGSFNSLNPLDSALVLAGDLPQISLEPPQPPLVRGGQDEEEEKEEEKEGKEGEENQNRYLTLRDGRRFRIETQCLTLKEIFATLNLPLCRLVSLSACETGLVSRVDTDEYIGLASGFLYAGAGNVVSSLWSVSDFSTAFLMIRFYQNLRDEELSVCQALQAAQNWLRKVTRTDFLTWLKNEVKMDQILVADLKIYIRRSFPNLQPFANPQYWAAFCAIGL
ncbi:CHAT domain-containing protein [Phormidium nigroviride]